jgi:alkylation response protein AidB-like acyl-CoA dehydrogenase
MSEPVRDEFEDEQFRAEVRAFIAEHAPRFRLREGVRVPRDAAQEREIRRWLGTLHAAGYLGAGWPAERGGRPGHRPTRDLIVMEELFRARAYRPLDQVMLASHAILAFGTDAQKDEYLPRIRSGEHIWCQLFSEPGAGSDLASLRTRATWDGTAYVVSGQKTWCTDGQWADMGTLLARTDPDAGRHAGLTAFVVPMRTPGITVRPIREMTGESEFCEVFLDDVRLPPQSVLGQVGGGWTVISSGLASERAFVGANAVQLDMMLDDLVALARAARLPDGSRAIDHEDVQGGLADALAKTEAAKLTVRDTVERIIRGEEHPSDGPLSKLVYTELNVELCERAMELLTAADYVTGEGQEVVQRWHEAFLWSRALTISGGASEILRGLVGRQLLGLPRA